MNENKIAELLVALRKSRGFTQNDLAIRLDVSFQAVSKWERGENLPDSLLLLELAKIYNITVDEILRGELIKKENIEKLVSRKKFMIISAIVMLILSPISIFVYGIENWDQYVIVILAIAAISVTLILYATLSTERMKSYSNKSREQKRTEEIVYAICAGIFLTLGLVWGLFHIAWVVFIFGYAITLILNKK